MVKISKVFGSFVALTALSLIPELAFCAELTAAVATDAMNRALKAQGRAGAGKVMIDGIVGCIPAFGRSNDEFVCALNGRTPQVGSGTSNILYVSFRRNSEAWTALGEENFEPACAPTAVAERELRRIRNNDSIRLKGEIDDGEGTFTDERGMMRDKKGPLRVMCRYVEDAASSGADETLYISYVWFKDGHYTIDSDVEIWSD